ncbi:MAG: NADH-quinone oxidoreductase subunit A [Nitrososphaerota archaeon]
MALLTDGSFWFVIYILLLMGAGLTFYAVAFALAPRKSSAIKEDTFESGQLPPGEKRVRLVMQYFVFLLLFLVFDVVSMFLFSWGYFFFSYTQTQSLYPVLFLLFVIPSIYVTVKIARQVSV